MNSGRGVQAETFQVESGIRAPGTGAGRGCAWAWGTCAHFGKSRWGSRVFLGALRTLALECKSSIPVSAMCLQQRALGLNGAESTEGVELGRRAHSSKKTDSKGWVWTMSHQKSECKQLEGVQWGGKKPSEAGCEGEEEEDADQVRTREVSSWPKASARRELGLKSRGQRWHGGPEGVGEGGRGSQRAWGVGEGGGSQAWAPTSESTSRHHRPGGEQRAGAPVSAHP